MMKNRLISMRVLIKVLLTSLAGSIGFMVLVNCIDKAGKSKPA